MAAQAEVSKVKLAIYLVFSVLLISFSFYAYQICFTPNILVERDEQMLIIHQGETFRDMQQNLYKNNFVNDLVSFSFLARLTGYSSAIVPGRYLLRSNMTNLQALRFLKSGKQHFVKITFSNIRLRSELVAQIAKYVHMEPKEFNDALDNFIVTNQDGFTEDNIMCMFLPNTYEVYANILPEDLIQKMRSEYKKFWNEKRLTQAADMGLTPIEVSILASIVQAEVVKKMEAPIIAGLYINRLKKGMPLQADPTVVFAAANFKLKRVLNNHKETDSRYNTYKYAGLPPGPINAPQIAMVTAVLNYARHDYYYMCAKEDFSGFHFFEKNFVEHSKHAIQYQKALTLEMKKAKQ